MMPGLRLFESMIAVLAAALTGCALDTPTAVFPHSQFALERWDVSTGVPKASTQTGAVEAPEAARVPTLATATPAIGRSSSGSRSEPREPTGSVAAGTSTLKGRLDGPGVSVAYFSRGREGFSGTHTDAEGNFEFEVALSGPETGLLVVREPGPTGRLGLTRVRLESGKTFEASDFYLVSPENTAFRGLEAPAGLDSIEHAVWAVEDPEGVPWRVPVWVQADADAQVPYFPIADVTFATGVLAVVSDYSRGSLVSGPIEDMPAFLSPPDLSGLPDRLTGGVSLSWPAVSDASVYTLRLYSASSATPLWETAVTQPAAIVPTALELPEVPMSLEVAAWDAPEVTLDAIVSRGTLRVPAAPSGPQGRQSWSIRPFGSPLKP